MLRLMMTLVPRFPRLENLLPTPHTAPALAAISLSTKQPSSTPTVQPLMPMSPAPRPQTFKFPSMLCRFQTLFACILTF
jgi:hypothetical protein